MSYQKILAWEKSDQLALAIYQVTKSFPKGETYGLVSQLRRSALSVPTNIVEGYSRQSNTSFAAFLDIAFGSLIETRYLLSFSYKAGLLDENSWNRLDQQAEEVGKIIWSYMRTVKENARSRKRK